MTNIEVSDIVQHLFVSSDRTLLLLLLLGRSINQSFLSLDILEFRLHGHSWNYLMQSCILHNYLVPLYFKGWALNKHFRVEYLMQIMQYILNTTRKPWLKQQKINWFLLFGALERPFLLIFWTFCKKSTKWRLLHVDLSSAMTKSIEF